MRRSGLLVLAAVALTACGGQAGGRGTESMPASEVRERRNPDVISTEEIERMRARGATDALTLIERARPLWLRPRGGTLSSAAPRVPVVYFNERRIGPPTTLRTFPASQIESFEYLSPARAMGRYGSDGENGIIVVKSL